MKEQRTKVVDNAVQQALAKCEELDIPTEKRIIRKRRLPGGGKRCWIVIAAGDQESNVRVSGPFSYGVRYERKGSE